MSDFKVGDRFSVEGVVTELADPDGEYCALFDGADSDDYVACSIMAHATLIEPADKVAENKVLDLSKPIRAKAQPLMPINAIFGPTSLGTYMVESGSYAAYLISAEDLENIPEPKRTATREMVMVDDGMGTQPYILYDHMEFEEISFVGKIIARGTITLTEGDGMEGVK